MSKKLLGKIGFLFLGVLLLAIFFRFASLLYFPDSAIILQKGALQELTVEKPLTQKFTAQRAGLSQVEILLRTPGIKFENGDKVKAELSDENCEIILRSGALEKSFLNSPNLYLFSFPRLSDSAGKNFCLKLTFLPQKKTAKNIQIFTMGEAENQPLAIRMVYKNSYLWQDLRELNQRISQYHPWFLKNVFLSLIIFGFVIISVLTVTLLIL